MRAYAFTCILLTACAAQPPYNPYHLASNPRTRVGELCEKVMRLRPQEPLQPGYWPGDPDPGFWTNSYRACVATLSQSLAQTAAAQESARTDARCRARGYRSGSAELATCVLTETDTRADSPPAAAGAALAPHLTEPLPAIFSARKEEWVCAQIGLEPPGEPFSRCVKALERALLAKDMNYNYVGN
jgi:hypothetical protein